MRHRIAQDDRQRKHGTLRGKLPLRETVGFGKVTESLASLDLFTHLLILGGLPCPVDQWGNQRETRVPPDSNSMPAVTWIFFWQRL